MLVSTCLGCGHPGPAHRVALRLKLWIDPKIAVSGPSVTAVWELRRLQIRDFDTAVSKSNQMLKKPIQNHKQSPYGIRYYGC